MPTKRVSVNDLLKRNRNNTNNLDLYANGNDYINHYRYYSHLFRANALKYKNHYVINNFS